MYVTPQYSLVFIDTVRPKTNGVDSILYIDKEKLINTDHY